MEKPNPNDSDIQKNNVKICQMNPKFLQILNNSLN
jgi:hypothetical protein